MKKIISELYQKYPLLFIIVVFLLLYALTVFLMRRATLNRKISVYTKSDKEIMQNSYLDRDDFPRGIRNNNPGNLRKTSIPWKGKIAGTDPSFEQFETFVWGLRAKILDIRNDIQKDGTNTINKLISEFAPPSENNTGGYIDQVCQYMSYTPDQILTGEREEMRRLSKIIIRIENGNPQTYIGRTEWFDDRTFDVAWDLSL